MNGKGGNAKFFSNVKVKKPFGKVFMGYELTFYECKMFSQLSALWPYDDQWIIFTCARNFHTNFILFLSHVENNLKIKN